MFSRGCTASPVSCLSPPLGWEQGHTLDGRVFYVNHTERETQWEKPPPAYSSVRTSQPPPPPPPRAKPAGRKAGPRPGVNQSTLIGFFKPTSASNAGTAEATPAVRGMSRLRRMHGKSSMAPLFWTAGKGCPNGSACELYWPWCQFVCTVACVSEVFHKN